MTARINPNCRLIELHHCMIKLRVSVSHL